MVEICESCGSLQGIYSSKDKAYVNSVHLITYLYTHIVYIYIYTHPQIDRSIDRDV